MKDTVKVILEYIDKHKGFIKRLIIFLLCYLVISFTNNPEILKMFKMIFGEYVATGIQALVPTYLLTSEV